MRQLRTPRSIVGGSIVCGLLASGIAHGQPAKPALEAYVGIELLLELGADINRQNLSGFTPLHHAVEAEALEAIELLLDRGADTTIKNQRNLTPAEFALATRRHRAADALGVTPRAE